MAKFLSVKEAAKLVGKSPSSIRRILYPILENDQHPDRKHIHPTPEDAKALRLKGENFPWNISEELLRREVPDAGAKGAGDSKAATHLGGDGSAGIVDMLRRELDIKNDQIRTQSELLKQLSERLREGNILMGSLQQQLGLPDAANRNRNDVVDAKPEAAKAEEGSEPARSSAPKKRGLFDWLFIKL
jgi:hypothetical protein